MSASGIFSRCFENTMETLRNIGQWNRLFEQHGDMIMPVKTAADVRRAKAEK